MHFTRTRLVWCVVVAVLIAAGATTWAVYGSGSTRASSDQATFLHPSDVPSTWPGPYLNAAKYWHPGGHLSLVGAAFNRPDDTHFNFHFKASGYKLTLVARCDTGRIRFDFGGATLSGPCAGRISFVQGGPVHRNFSVSVNAHQHHDWGIAVYTASAPASR
jgi:hypothetical protein